MKQEHDNLNKLIELGASAQKTYNETRQALMNIVTKNE